MATNWTNVTDWKGALAVANDNTGGWYWAAILFMIFIVSFISMLGFGVEASLLGAAFSSLMIGILLVYLGLVGWTWVAISVGVLITTFLWIMYSRND